MDAKIERLHQVMGMLPTYFYVAKNNALTTTNYFSWEPLFIYCMENISKEAKEYLINGEESVSEDENRATLINLYEDLITAGIIMCSSRIAIGNITGTGIMGRKLWLYLKERHGTLSQGDIVERIQHLIGPGKPNVNNFYESTTNWLDNWDVVRRFCDNKKLGKYMFLALLNDEMMNKEMLMKGVEEEIDIGLKDDFLKNNNLKEKNKKENKVCFRCERKAHTADVCPAPVSECPKIVRREKNKIKRRHKKEVHVGYVEFVGSL